MESIENKTRSSSPEHLRRDAETALLLGGFISIVSIPVLVGTFFAQASHAQMVNLGAALVLLGIGGSIATWGWLTLKKLR